MLYVCTYRTGGYARLWLLKHNTGDCVLTRPIGFWPYRVFAAGYLSPPSVAVVTGSRIISAPACTSRYMKAPCVVHDMPTWDSHASGRVFSDLVSLFTGNPPPKLCDNTPINAGKATYLSGVEGGTAEVERGDHSQVSLPYTQAIRRVDRFCISVCQTAGERASSYCLTNVRIVHFRRKSSMVTCPDSYVSARRVGSPYSIADNQLKLLVRRPRITSKSYLPLRFVRFTRRYYNTLPFALDHTFSRYLFKHIADQIHRIDRSVQIHRETLGSYRSIMEVSGIDCKQVRIKSRVIIPQQAAQLCSSTPVPVRWQRVVQLNRLFNHVSIGPLPAQLSVHTIQAYRFVGTAVFDSVAYDAGLIIGGKLSKTFRAVNVLSGHNRLTRSARPALRLCINLHGFIKTSHRLVKIDISTISGHRRPVDPVNSTLFVRSKPGGIKQYFVTVHKKGGKTDAATCTIGSEMVSREIASTCVTGVTWDEIFDWYRNYGSKMDRLQLPTVDFAYDLAKLYDFNTGLPYNPLSPIDRNEVRVEFPGTHPVGKYASVGLKIIGVHLWVLRDIILLLYRDRKEHGIQYEQMSGSDAVRLALDRLYNNLRFMDYKHEEYMRAFRHARWYGEYVIVNTSEYWLVRNYDSWISSERSYNIVDGLPADDRKYIARAENWGVDASLPFDRRTYATNGRQALIEFKVTNYCRSTLGFTIEVFDRSGSLQLRFYVDGKDKGYLLVPFGRVEATLAPGEHSILFEFEGGSDNDRVEINAISVDNITFKSAEVVERSSNTNGAEALDMLIDMLMRYYELHHTDKNKGTRLYRLSDRV